MKFAKFTSGDLVAVETGADTIALGGFASAGDGFEISIQDAMTAQLYAALGQTVIYTGQAGVSVFKMIIDNEDELFPGGFGAQATDGDVTARAQKASVAQPTRGDVIANKYGVSYLVEHYRTLNQSEWAMELRLQ